jgi:hypothetical protein
MIDGFSNVLVAQGPHASVGSHADTYGRLVGSWRGEIRVHRAAPSPVGSVEVHFAWALEGRAIQDVWITPARHDRGSEKAAPLEWYGTTLRVFDPKTGAWLATWTDPVSGHRIELVGHRQGDDIVQLATRGGRPIRWTFSNVQENSFSWYGHVLEFDGVTWRLEVEMHFQRQR